MASKGEKLSKKEELFILHYLQKRNATDAAFHAGYSVDRNSCGVIGWRLLRDVKIVKIIDEALSEQMRNLGLTKESWLASLCDLAFTTKRDKVRTDALKMLGDHFGFFETDSDNSGTDIKTAEGDLSTALEKIK